MKRILKRLFAGMMAAAMTAALCVGALAAEQASITVNNPSKGEEYALYHIFDATVAENGGIAYREPAGKPLTEELKADGFTVDTAGNVSYQGSSITANLAKDSAVVQHLIAYAGEPVRTVTADGQSGGLSASYLGEPLRAVLLGGDTDAPVLSCSACIPNTAGYVLPETGGRGLSGAVLGGLAAMAAACLLKKRIAN